MKNIVLLLLLIGCHFVNAQHKLPFKLEKSWEATGFQNPESVVLDTANNVLYVSNINGEGTAKDANGYISKVGLDGKIINQKWVTGLNAPKGLAIYNNTLYIADIDALVAVEISTKKREIYNVKNATFLNDVTVDERGNVYASNTFGFSAIYKLPNVKNRKIIPWFKDELLNSPNGIYIQENKLFVASWGANPDPQTFKTKIPGKLFTINLEDKRIEDVSVNAGNLDGLEATIHGFLITDWLAGSLLYYSNETGTLTQALDLSQGSADIHFDKKTKSVFIPQMLDGTLTAYIFKGGSHNEVENLGKEVKEVQLINFEKLPHDTISNGITRQWLHGAKGQLAYFHLKKGAHIPMHKHPNEQITYIMKGKVRVVTYYKGEKKEYIVNKGQVIIFPENVPHEFFVLKNTLDLDVHVPVRQDWLTNELPEYLKNSN